MSEGQAIANAIDRYSRPANHFPKPRQPSALIKVSTSIGIAACNFLSIAQNAKAGTFVFVVTIHDFRNAEACCRSIGVFNDHDVARQGLEAALTEKRYGNARVWRRDIDEGDCGGDEAVRKGHIHDVVGVVAKMKVKGAGSVNVG